MHMPLACDAKQTIIERLKRDLNFRQALRKEAMECLLDGEADTGEKILKDYFDPLIHGIRERASNLYLTRQMLCAEAILTALNQGLGGGLSDEQAVAMAAPFCIGLGESGCLCGALGGAQAGVGLLLGKDHVHRLNALTLI